GDRADPFGGETVDPHQLLGIEVNPRAAAIAEMVLWIGYLQWHFRTRGNVQPPEPVLRDFRNIECRDAVLAWDRIEAVTDEHGRPVTRWDGRTTKPSPVTGEPIPDDSARVPVLRYVNPRKAEWPAADFVVGNPPFIGTKRMRQLLGDGYVDAVRGVRPEIEDSADFVMLWWAKAAELVKSGALRRSGLITTKALQQNFNRRVVAQYVGPDTDVALAYAIPNHPWVDSKDGAAVRIAMTVIAAGLNSGRLSLVQQESQGIDGETEVELATTNGLINCDLRIGANLQNINPLRANHQISGMGVALHGAGFVLTPDQAEEMRPLGESVIRGYVGGRDLLQSPRERFIVDFSGLSMNEARLSNPAAFQRVMDHVKPERDHNSRKSIRELWWRFGWERPILRRALIGLGRYIGTTETAKHRVFQFVRGDILADHMVVCVASASAQMLGVLSSRLHAIWALALGGRLGAGNDPRYNKNRCWDPFPFPLSISEFQNEIATLAEQIDTHRKRQQALHPELTLTGAYNVLEKLRRGEPLNEKERRIHEQGLVSVLRELHDELDRAVFAAYGWNDLAERLVGRPGATTPWPEKPAEQAEAEEELLTRLVALNAERAEEEARGLIRWLRPDYQNPGHATPAQTDLAIPDDPEPAADDTPEATPAASKQPWPKTVPDQARAIADLLAQSKTALSLDAIANHYTARGRWRDRLPQLLDTLTALGRARQEGTGWRGA
ncbi:MAG: class I SAM-dependent DNA methyltransferase, partial [Xanthomonadales bacterium]|nr:class I SAM-dependent DNA methyltransferase [Xanthomonadales bacterium]